MFFDEVRDRIMKRRLKNYCGIKISGDFIVLTWSWAFPSIVLEHRAFGSFDFPSSLSCVDCLLMAVEFDLPCGLTGICEFPVVPPSGDAVAATLLRLPLIFPGAHPETLPDKLPVPDILLMLLLMLSELLMFSLFWTSFEWTFIREYIVPCTGSVA